MITEKTKYSNIGLVSLMETFRSVSSSTLWTLTDIPKTMQFLNHDEDNECLKTEIRMDY